MRYQSTKTYTAERGLSCCFRQHRANSHCNFLHGYAIGFSFTFEADSLDYRNWVVDFGELKVVKAWLDKTFDHKCLVADDDPDAKEFHAMAAIGIIDMVTLPKVGCEAFAELAGRFVAAWLDDAGYAPRVRLRSVECREHAGNSAIYFPVYSNDE